MNVNEPEDLPLIQNEYNPQYEEGIIEHVDCFTRDDVTSFVMAVCGDTDKDGILNYDDNCPLTANPGQEDTNGDGYGNMCDCDLDNNDRVWMSDYAIFGNAWNSRPDDPNWNPDADFNSNDRVWMGDYSIFGSRWNSFAPFY